MAACVAVDAGRQPGAARSGVRCDEVSAWAMTVTFSKDDMCCYTSLTGGGVPSNTEGRPALLYRMLVPLGNSVSFSRRGMRPRCFSASDICAEPADVDHSGHTGVASHYLALRQKVAPKAYSDSISCCGTHGPASGLRPRTCCRTAPPLHAICIGLYSLMITMYRVSYPKRASLPL